MSENVELHLYVRGGEGTYQKKEFQAISEIQNRLSKKELSLFDARKILLALREKYEKALEQFPTGSGEGNIIFENLLTEVDTVLSCFRSDQIDVGQKAKEKRKRLSKNVKVSKESTQLPYRDEATISRHTSTLVTPLKNVSPSPQSPHSDKANKSTNDFSGGVNAFVECVQSPVQCFNEIANRK